MEIIFAIRKPVFPVICDFNNTLVSFKNSRDMTKNMLKYNLAPDESYDLIDSSGESCIINCYEDKIIIAPFFFERLTKRKVIDMFNNRSNRSSEELYVLKNPDSKKFSVLIGELAELLKD
jgi:hypothetical protein